MKTYWSVALAAMAGVLLLLVGLRSSTARETQSPPLRIYGPLTFEQRQERDRYFIERHGFQLGVPKDGYAKAVAQLRRQQKSLANYGNIAGSPSAAGPKWVFIGPQPIAGFQTNFAGFGTTGVGPKFAVTGRISAIAVDPSGNIYAGAATGGVWLSTDGANTFTSIGDSLPTQSVGAMAVDVNTAPPTVYVGTGEGNSSSDSYYGLGLFSSNDFGKTWTPVDPSKFQANGAFQAFTTIAAPCTPLFVGTGNGNSDSIGNAGYPECEPGIFGCRQGAIYESLDEGSTWHRTFGKPNPADPNGGAVRSYSLGAIVDSVTLNPIPAMFATIDLVGVVATQDNSGLPFTCGSPSLAAWNVLSTPASSVGRSSVAADHLNIYTIIGASDGKEYSGFFTSGAGGASWTTETIPCAQSADGKTFTAQKTCSPNDFPTLDGGTQGVFLQAQSSYDQALVLSPDKSTLYFGGLGVYSSTDQGNSWTFLIPSGGTHPD